jgi:hypothetical protein
MEYISKELEKEAEQKLCHNWKCTNGENGKRKNLDFNVPISTCAAGFGTAQTPAREETRRNINSCHFGRADRGKFRVSLALNQ